MMCVLHYVVFASTNTDISYFRKKKKIVILRHSLERKKNESNGGGGFWHGSEWLRQM